MLVALFVTLTSSSAQNLNNVNRVEKQDIPVTQQTVQVTAQETKPVEPSPQPPTETPQPQVEVKAEPTPVQVEAPPTPPTPTYSGSHEDWLAAAGIPQSEWAAVDYIVTHESTWRVGAVNASSGATGLCQALPASKMASAGADYLTNPVTQLIWCTNYANSRYGGWWGAYSFWVNNHWW